MLHLFYGNDTVAVRKKAISFVETLEKDGLTIESIDTENYTEGILNDIAGAESLFGEKTLYILDTPSLKKDFYEDVIEHLPVLQESANMFVVIEGVLLAPEKKKFAKYAEQIEECKKTAEERFNAFGMADSLAKRDKKNLWVQLQQAKLHNLSAEEIIGTLWWQLKTLQLAKSTTTAAEAGMKDFPYNKAKRSLSNFKEGELERISYTLLSLYHDGHSGRADIDLALEKWALNL